MATTTNGFDGGTDTVAVTTGNSGGASGTAFDAVNGGPVYTASQFAHGTIGIDTSLAAAATRDVRWSTTVGSPSSFFIRDYARIGGNPSVIARLFQTLAAGTARWGIAVDTAGHIGVRNLALGAFATTGLSTLTLTVNSWFRYEASASWNSTDWTVILRIFVGANVDGITPDETVTTTGGLTLASVDTYAWGCLASASTTWASVFHDSIGIDTVTWLGPDVTTATSAPGPMVLTTPTRTSRPVVNLMRGALVDPPSPQPAIIVQPVARSAGSVLLLRSPAADPPGPAPIVLASPARPTGSVQILIKAPPPMLVTQQPIVRIAAGRWSSGGIALLLQPPPPAQVVITTPTAPGSLTVTTRGPALSVTTGQPALTPTVRSASLSLTIAGGDP